MTTCRLKTSQLGLGLCLTFAVVGAPTVANLALNPGFEQLDAEGIPTGWRLPRPAYSMSREGPRSGKECLKYSNDDASRYQLASVPLALKTGQRYEFSVWVKTLAVSGSDTGATACIEWTDADGNYIGGAYPPGIKGTSTEWTRVRGITRRIPDNATAGSLTCYVRKGMTGTAWFDDVEVHEYFPPLVDAMTADAYRGVYAGGSARITVGLTLAQQGLQPDNVAIKASVLDEASKVVANGRVVAVAPDRGTIVVDMDALPVGSYTLLATASARDGTRAGKMTLRLRRVAALPSRTVRIDASGRTLVEEKPFFPLGTYWGGMSEEHLALYARSPFNCLMPYGRPNPAQMDLAHSHGLKVIYSVKDYYAGTKYSPDFIKTEADERPALEQVVRRYRAHPALLAWYINDELPMSMLNRLARHQQWIEELDPNHPSWVVLYQVADVRRYLSTFDVIGTDPYPIPHDPASKALNWTRRTHAAVFGGRAVWQVPQIFDRGAYKKGEAREKTRAPTLLEMRSMAWQCIAGGANGLVFYSWFDLWRMTDRDPFETRWRDIVAMATEIAERTDILLADAATAPLGPPPDAAVAWRAWQNNDAMYLLLVNSSTDKQTIRVPLQHRTVSIARDFGKVALKRVDGGCSVTLPPLEPALLRWPAPRP